jgi:phage-related protein
LNPVLHALGVAFGHIGRTISSLMDVLGPIIDMVGNLFDAFSGLLDVLDPMQYVIKLIGAVFKLIGMAMLEVSNGIQTFVGWVLGIIKDFVRSVIPNSGDTVKFLQDLQDKMNQGAKDAQNKVQDMWASLGDDMNHFFDPTDNKDTTVTDLNSATGDASGNISDLGATAADAATKVEKMTEQLTNVPQGFKVALARFNATAAVGPDTAAAGGALTGGASVNITVQGSVIAEDDLYAGVARSLQKSSYIKTGIKWPK